MINKNKNSIKLYSFGFVFLFLITGIINHSVPTTLNLLESDSQNEIVQGQAQQELLSQIEKVIKKDQALSEKFLKEYPVLIKKNGEKIVSSLKSNKVEKTYLDTESLAPPTGGLSGKMIEIDLTKQTFTCWENGKVWGHFMTSTGRPTMATKPGNFSILDHDPMAWSESAGCWMPWWMGIYFAGSTENGIHELPLYSGVQEPLSHLGQKISHGCVRLAPGVAKNVYDWAVNGTPVYIHH